MKKILKRVGLSALLLGAFGAAAVMIINLYMVNSMSGYVVTETQAGAMNADCVLILGAGVHPDGSPSNMLEDRLACGVRLYNAKAAPKLLMSGDHGSAGYDEVNTMKQYAMDGGVPSQDVFMDHAGFSTYESVYRAKEIFQAEKVILVTQKYHLYRALYSARKLGLDAYGVAADYQVYAGQTRRDIREVLARVKDFITGIVKPSPTYLGEAIPVNGNGDVTNDKP